MNVVHRAGADVALRRHTHRMARRDGVHGAAGCLQRREGTMRRRYALEHKLDENGNGRALGAGSSHASSTGHLVAGSLKPHEPKVID